MSNMKIVHETPIDYLGLSRAYNDLDYAIAHLRDIPQYWTFFKESLRLGREVILDNGAHELGEAFDSHQFAEAVLDLKPTYYVLPDKLNDMDITTRRHLEFLEKYEDCRKVSKPMAVIQGNTYDELIECYKLLAPAVDKVAIPFASAAFDRKKGLDKMRPHFCKYLLASEAYKAMPRPLHLLGAYDAREFAAPIYNDPAFESLDTSNPVTAAIEGKRYGEDGIREKSKYVLCKDLQSLSIPVDVELMIYNIKKFRKIVRGENCFTQTTDQE